MKPGEARHGAREATPSNVLHAPSAAAWVRLVWLSHTSACVQGAWPPHAPPAGLNFDGAVRRTDPNASEGAGANAPIAAMLRNRARDCGPDRTGSDASMLAAEWSEDARERQRRKQGRLNGRSRAVPDTRMRTAAARARAGRDEAPELGRRQRALCSAPARHCATRNSAAQHWPQPTCVVPVERVSGPCPPPPAPAHTVCRVCSCSG